MSRTSIATAIKTFLSDNLGPTATPTPGPILQIETVYPRVLPDQMQVYAIVWPIAANERRLAGGQGGLKTMDYQILTHLYFTGLDDDAMSDPTFFAVVDSVLALYRDTSKFSISLGTVGNTANSRVVTFGENMHVDTPQPRELGQGTNLLLQAIITCEVQELIQA